jgi:aldose 1-epimerase
LQAGAPASPVPVRSGLPGAAIRLNRGMDGHRDGFESVTLTSASGTVQAELVPAANMLCCSLTHRGVELLPAGRGVRAYAERGKTMGIPLLHPWANRIAHPRYAAAGKEVVLPAAAGRYGIDAPTGLPIHGALPGLLRWQVDGDRSDDRIAARLQWSSPALLELFPFVHELALDAHVADDRLELATTLRATGSDSVPISFGYHPYLSIPGVARQEWDVTLGASQRLVLDDHQLPTGDHEPIESRAFRLGDQSWDDGLADLAAPPEFGVSAGNLALTVTFDRGYAYAQLFAPPAKDLICFEPMTAPTNALVSGDGLTVIAPGEEYRAAFSIAVADGGS